MPNTNPNRDEILKCPAKILIEDHSLRRYSANLRGSLCVQIMLHQRKCLRISLNFIAWMTILYGEPPGMTMPWSTSTTRSRRTSPTTTTTWRRIPPPTLRNPARESTSASHQRLLATAPGWRKRRRTGSEDKTQLWQVRREQSDSQTTLPMLIPQACREILRHIQDKHPVFETSPSYIISPLVCCK